MRELRFPVESLQMLLFSRATGGHDEISSASSHTSVAPPTFTESLQHLIPDYVWRPVAGQPWIGSGGGSYLPAEEADGIAVLHAEQHFEYFVPIRSGDQLIATTRDGDSWTKTNRRGEQLEFREIVTEFHDQSGALVVRSRAVEVRTNVASPASGSST